MEPLSRRCRRRRTDDDLFLAARSPYVDTEQRHLLGPMNVACAHCGALHWIGEKLARSSDHSPKFGMCCHEGQISLPQRQDPPRHIQELFLSQEPHAREFRENIWKYNRAFSFTSLGVNEVHSVNNGRGPPVFCITGELCHWSGSLVPHNGQLPKYAQLYIYEPREALAARMQQNQDLDEQIMETLQTFLLQHHQYAPVYRHAWEILRLHPNIENHTVTLHLIPGSDRRRYNLPTCDEPAVIIPTTPFNSHRDIVLRSRDGPLHRIYDIHPAYCPLQYPLLHLFGEDGWHEGLTVVNSNKRLSQCKAISYYLEVRPNQFSTLLRGGRLFCRYIVDMYASVDQNRLLYLQNHQPQLRASLYSGLEDAVGEGDDNLDLNNVGSRTVLPSSYIGGPRNMSQCYQDSMAIARYFRKVDIFLTMTTNPEWEEIKGALYEGQTAYDRPDIVARVFQLKKNAVLEYISKHGVFGHTAAYVYTIEFQKRGLPHMHSLIFLKEPHKLSSPKAIDSCIWARWPDPETEPLLFETIKKCMVHGPCGALNPRAPCMENGKCTKGYPKPFQAFTVMDPHGYPHYYRPDDGRAFEVRGHMLDNRWIVPYSPFLCGTFNCHINTECAFSLGTFKYAFKYIQKGSDLATVAITDKNNEILRWKNGHFISPPLAAWRLKQFEIHELVPNVVRLQVHLPGQHMVTFNPNENLETVMQRAATEQTTLTAFFAANADQGPLGVEARTYTYQEFPQKFVFKNRIKKWALRQSGFALGRMYFVPPTAGERFYLRTLLTVVKGPQSFEDLRTYNGICYESFHGACLARGLLEDDGEWRQCLTDAALIKTGQQLRRLFATLLLFCAPSEPHTLWTQFREHICDDLRPRITQLLQRTPTEDEIYDFGLYETEKILNESGRLLSDWPSMPRPTNDWASIEDNSNALITEQLAYNRHTELASLERNLQCLNQEQEDAYNHIIQSVELSQGRIFFVNGPGGTGKTFLYNTICNKVRSEGWIVLCVASSGIAALLIRGGRTAHSMFKIPINNLNEDSFCHIPKESHRAGLLQATRLIIWDEIGAQHRYAPEALDRTCRDIRNNDRPFGGITVVFGGDFQQTLPVIPRGSRDQIIDATIQRSLLWEHAEILKLHRNMRLEADDRESQSFSEWLLDVGHGRGNNDGKINLPAEMRLDDINDLIDDIYPAINTTPPPPPDYFLQRMILAPRNADVSDVNHTILAQMSGEEHVYFSADQLIHEEGADGALEPIPVEFLRSVNAQSLPPGELPIKIGCPLILLRNLSPSHGLCNGTRMVVTRMSSRVLEVRIIGGDHGGELAFIPRIALIPSNSTEFTFKFRRLQFPVRLAFALSINKSQGQSVRFVGLDLRYPAFSHGQLYVALSRATSPRRIRYILPEDAVENYTTNVVYPEVLLD